MNCHVCSKEITRSISPKERERNKHFFCGRPCYVIHWASEHTGAKNGKWNPDNQHRCLVCSKDFRRSTPKSGPPKYCSMRCFGIAKLGTNTGPSNNKWKGGVTEQNEKIRKSPEYEAWRKEVYRRDGWSCQFCLRHLKQLVAHHIKTFEHFPELRFEVTNGITLCRACHCRLHAEHRDTNDFTNILNDYTPDINRKIVKI